MIKVKESHIDLENNMALCDFSHQNILLFLFFEYIQVIYVVKNPKQKLLIDVSIWFPNFPFILLNSESSKIEARVFDIQVHFSRRLF